MTEADVQDPFETWMGSYGHRPHDLMHVFTRVDMRAAFCAGMRTVVEVLDETGPGASSLTPGPGRDLQ